MSVDPVSTSDVISLKEAGYPLFIFLFAFSCFQSLLFLYSVFLSGGCLHICCKNCLADWFPQPAGQYLKFFTISFSIYFWIVIATTYAESFRLVGNN